MNEQKSLVDSFTEYDIVEVFNPLSNDFVGQVATSVVNPEAYVDKTIERMGLRSKTHPTMNHVVNKITIPSGQTLKMPGHVARVVVTQLVNEIMQRDGSVKQMGDKALRNPYEERIVVNNAKFTQQVDLLTAEERFQRQLAELNKVEVKEVAQNDRPFTTFGDTQGADDETGTVTESSAPRRGRPPKSETQTANS